MNEVRILKHPFKKTKSTTNRMSINSVSKGKRSNVSKEDNIIQMEDEQKRSIQIKTPKKDQSDKERSIQIKTPKKDQSDKEIIYTLASFDNSMPSRSISKSKYNLMF